MARFEQDTVKRQIRQLGDLVAAIVSRARADQDYESGLEAIRDAAGEGFGLDRSMLDRLDAASAALLLRDSESARVYAAVCAAEAELLEKLGRSAEAAERAERASQVERASRGPSRAR